MQKISTGKKPHFSFQKRICRWRVHRTKAVKEVLKSNNAVEINFLILKHLEQYEDQLPSLQNLRKEIVYNTIF